MSLRFFKWFLPLIVLLFWTGSAAAFDQTGAATGGSEPSIQIPEPTFDFGDNVKTDEVVHQFTVKNTGTAVLEIKKVTPG